MPKNKKPQLANSESVASAGIIHFGREICGDLPAAESREWLVTNGMGGFASGTIATGMTRRYHGLLIAALQPPLGRTHLVGGCDEVVHYAGSAYALATHHWSSGVVAPRGFVYVESFRLDGAVPIWTYALADALLEKRIWMVQGENTTFLQYTLLRASSALDIECKALVNYRDFHANTHAGDWHMRITPVEHGVAIHAFDGAVAFYLRSEQASCEPRHEWYRDCFLPREQERGLDAREDHLFAAVFGTTLNSGESFSITASTEANADLNAHVSIAAQARQEAAILDPGGNKTLVPRLFLHGSVNSFLRPANSSSNARCPASPMTIASLPVITGLATGAATP